jgi:DNA-binding NarL/FixJ family response regulator
MGDITRILRSEDQPMNLKVRGLLRVLLVEDSEAWRRWLHRELGKLQQLQIVGEGTDGIEAVKKTHELKPDLILLDIGLPNLDGIEAAIRIVHSTPDSKIVFFTMQDDPDIVRLALSIGAQGYVLKRDAITDLSAAVAAVLRGQRFVSRRLEVASESLLFALGNRSGVRNSMNIAHASLDVSLASSREALLRQAGYTVTTFRSAAELRDSCKQQSFGLLVVGHSLEYSARVEMWSVFRSVNPGSPILQLLLPYETSGGAEYTLDPYRPEELLRLVQDIVSA